VFPLVAVGAEAGPFMAFDALQQLFNCKVECVCDAQDGLERRLPARLNALPEKYVIPKICRHVHLSPALGFAQRLLFVPLDLSEVLIVIMHSPHPSYRLLSTQHSNPGTCSYLFSNDISGLRRPGAAATEAMVPVD
jgi:hypothetical protein